MSGKDVLVEIGDCLAFSGVVLNRTYYPKSVFEKVSILDKSEIQLIPCQDHMTVADLLRHVKNLEYCSSVVISGMLYPEAQFHNLKVPETAKVLLLAPVQGG
jgi:sulfur carrier protein ThiS